MQTFTGILKISQNCVQLSFRGRICVKKGGMMYVEECVKKKCGRLCEEKCLRKCEKAG